MDLLAGVPALSLALDSVLAQLDRLRDAEGLFQRVTADLQRRAPHTATRGRASTPVAVILRRLVVKRLYGWSDEETAHCGADSLVLRPFCRSYLEAVPDDTAQRWAAYARRRAVAQQSGRPAAQVQALLARRIAVRLPQDLPLVRQAMCQAHRRVLEGSQGPAAETRRRLFAPHTQVIQRHKPGKPVECGRNVWGAEVEGGLISTYGLVAQPGPDAPYLGPSVAGHIVRFG